MNLSVAEYLPKLDEVAGRYGADPRYTHAPTNPERTWTAPLGGVGVTLALESTSMRDASAAWVPRLRIGTSATLPTDPLAALAQLRDTEATLQRAMAAWALLTRCRVYWGDVPCENCSGSGKTFRRDVCASCNGTGVRLRASKEGGG